MRYVFMLDFVSSKVAMSVAAIMVLVSALGFYQVYSDNLTRMEYEGIADRVAGTVNEAGTLAVEATWRFVFGDGAGDDVRMKAEVRGQGYMLELGPARVVVDTGEERFAAGFVSPVHTWRPQEPSYTSEEMRANDGNSTVLILSSGQDFALERKKVLTDSGPGYASFIYPL